MEGVFCNYNRTLNLPTTRSCTAKSETRPAQACLPAKQSVFSAAISFTRFGYCCCRWMTCSGRWPHLSVSGLHAYTLVELKAVRRGRRASPSATSSTNWAGSAPCPKDFLDEHRAAPPRGARPARHRHSVPSSTLTPKY